MGGACATCCLPCSCELSPTLGGAERMHEGCKHGAGKQCSAHENSFAALAWLYPPPCVRQTRARTMCNCAAVVRFHVLSGVKHGQSSDGRPPRCHGIGAHFAALCGAVGCCAAGEAIFQCEAVLTADDRWHSLTGGCQAWWSGPIPSYVLPTPSLLAVPVGCNSSCATLA